MFTLLNAEDSKVMANSRFVKNAIFYKDMFAFFDAYEHIMKEDKKNLPNFCLHPNQQYCLEGICLFVKLYASEFGFETLKLTLDYLKVIYYTIAGYADGETVQKQIILNEFEEYKKASINVVGEAEKEIGTYEEKYNADRTKYEKMSNQYAKSLVTSNILNIFFIVFAVIGVVSAMLPFTFYFLKYLTMNTAIIASGVLLVVGLAISFVFRYYSRKLQVNANDTAYSIQTLKRAKDFSFSELKQSKDKSNRIISEKYEYLNSFADALDGFVNKLSFKEILNKGNEYRLVSYNVKADVERLFKNQEADIKSHATELNLLPNSPESMSDMARIYKDIKNQDWLYYNNEVRFTFLRKFVEISEKSHSWSLDVDGELLNPFGFDVKSLAKEEIAYLKSKEDLFVTSSIDNFLNTRYARNLKEFEIKGNASAELLKNIKVGYMDHFYNYEKLKDYNNLFYDRKLADGIKISEEILSETKKIPTYVLLKIKLLENNIGMGNSDSVAIQQIVDEINGVFGVEPIAEENVILDESDITYPDKACEEIVDVDEETIRFVYDGNTYFARKSANT